MELNKITELVIGAGIEVHSALGPGLLESAYQECLFFEIRDRGLTVRKEVKMPITYKQVKLDHGYRMDLLVEEQLVVELKAVEELTDVHLAQMLTYLKLGDFKLGLIMNFHEKLLKNGIRRVINS